MTRASPVTGCELPEDVRLQYLDAMGVTSWQLQHPVAEAAEQVAAQSGATVPAGKAEVIAPLVPHEAPAGWDALQAAVASCERCEELCHSRTRTVFGVGNHDADLLVIGEAPGRDEDEQGEPFVGRAGQLLTAMLKAIELDRDEVYIANILKCRPPNNRDPAAIEAANCSRYLQQQIELIKPKMIMVVGRIAAQSLLATDETIGSLRGRLHDYNGIPVIVTYHPAYLLRQPSEKRKSWQDLQQLKKLL